MTKEEKKGADQTLGRTQWIDLAELRRSLAQRDIEQQPPKKIFEKKISGIEVEICLGDVTNAIADVVVASANNYAVLGSGSAGAVRKKGGRYDVQESIDIFTELFEGVIKRLPSFPIIQEFLTKMSKVQRECFKQLAGRPIDPETGLIEALPIPSLMVTGSHDIGARSEKFAQYVYHLVCMGYKPVLDDQKQVIDVERITTTPQAIWTAIIMALQKMQEQGLETIAVPLIGGGSGSLDPKLSILAMLNAVKNFGLQPETAEFKPTLKIVIHESEKDKLTKVVRTIQDFV